MFFEQQKNAILREDTLNIVAGPGSGKTTVLTAKCALLLNKNKNKSKGICLITHTNVAVDEIKMNLGKMGFKDIEYPNFIGTIQEFFNTFFAKKAFHLVLGNKKFRVLDDEEYKERFNYYFELNKPNWYTSNCPNVFKNNPKLEISDDMSFNISSDAKYAYRDSFNNSINQLFIRGFVTNKQCLELAKWYIERYRDPIRRAISTRFNFVLLDEAQDTNNLQYDLLNQLFYDNGLAFQRYGDPYQALYNIYEDIDDTWVPMKELNRIPKYDISETSRFGENIARVVRNLCIDRYDEFKSLELVDSFKPYFFVYENEEDLITSYRKLINELEAQSERFATSFKKDAILSVMHDDLSAIFNSYSKPTIRVKKNESNIKQAYNFLLGILSKKLDLSFKDTKYKLDSNIECKQLLSFAVKSLLLEKTNDVVEVNLYKILSILTQQPEEEIFIYNVTELFDSFRSGIVSSVKVPDSFEDEFYIGTIHSVKGETHRSTLLVLNSIFRDYSVKTSYSIVELLQNYLIGNYINPASIIDEQRKKETYKALKLAYVALSRPTHLSAIAIPQSLVDQKFLECLRDFGWIEYQLRANLI
ncbi:TPA: UvrD-helicase domain-containing protein [Bacillus cereus]|nr:UvrD-helicase domain-containing protein [Bacillus cereus]HDR8060810.1 UvrD-helicase domain-containing protein [Bacillus cereus]HDR8078342.1 UvrD-helicase domain-containing protein [Bacillus cereus]HDR8209089.1 UvrD-helicase domain-containing protein [Bacillus cereus]HDR8215249.1 UvrD-helicase domain-containing protein [Bacillus cereus]